MQIDFTTDGFFATDADGNAVASYPWGEDADAALAALTSALGRPTEAKMVEAPDGQYLPDLQWYSWDCVEIYMLPDGVSYEGPDIHFRITVTKPQCSATALTLEGDIQVGQTGASVQETHDPVKRSGWIAQDELIFLIEHEEYEMFGCGGRMVKADVDPDTDEIVALAYQYDSCM